MEDKDNHLMSDDINFMAILRQKKKMPTKCEQIVTSPDEFTFYSADIENKDRKYERALRDRQKDKINLLKYIETQDERSKNTNVALKTAKNQPTRLQA
jgi:hypothetical protein